MRRADRLFQIVQILRRGRIVTARQMAERLEISERTVYRDIADLSGSGIPIESEAGVGYRLRNFDLPPLAFTRDEIAALVLGARIVESWADSTLARAAAAALAKVEAALPPERSDHVRRVPLFAPAAHWREAVAFDLAELRRAIDESRRIRFEYTDGKGAPTRRGARPLGLAFYGPGWILAAWCELRDDFRAFRPDRMRSLEVLDGFAPEPGKMLADFVRKMSDETALQP